MSRKYLDIFLREAEEQLASLQQGLLVLERQQNNIPLIHELLRSAHTVKGSARMLGLDGISAIAHAMEDCFKEFESGARPVDAGSIDRLLQGCDVMIRMTGAMGNNEEPPIDAAQFLTAFRNGEPLAQGTSKPLESATHTDTVRTKVAALDSIVNLVGELIICRQRLEDRIDMVRVIERELGRSPLLEKLRSFEGNLDEDIQQLDTLIQQLHGEALSLRMLPLKTITDGYQRTVRDVAKSLGKEVRLEVLGDHIELDRALIEELKPVLLHIITNAVAHGIEPSDERVAAGKPICGTIRLTASHEGESAKISVRDDGRGLDPEQIRQRAVQQGILDPRIAETLSDDESLYLTLRHGFSTTETVNDLSGRGVGLDVVSSGVEQLKGSLQLSSRRGRYFEITLHLPLTLSVIQALLISCGGETFAIPMSYVQEVVKLRESDILDENGTEGIMLRGGFVTLASLPDLLGLGDSPFLVEREKLTVVVLKYRGELLACAVDASHGDAEIVVKGFGDQLRHADYLFGATILSNGDPALILKVHDIFIATIGAGSAGIRARLQKLLTPPIKGTILSVDDSVTSRTIVRTILSANGYRVVSAESGEEALNLLTESSFDLMISDVEMPGINGYELVRTVRALPGFRDMPIIMVTSLGSDDDWREAMHAGAQAYIIKGDFDQGVLLDLVNTLINNREPSGADPRGDTGHTVISR